MRRRRRSYIIIIIVEGQFVVALASREMQRDAAAELPHT